MNGIGAWYPASKWDLGVPGVANDARIDNDGRNNVTVASGLPNSNVSSFTLGGCD